jgi:hypothetical protein
MPGIGGGPADEFRPEAGDVELSNGVAVERLTLGMMAGRRVVVETTDPVWLQQLIDAATLAQSRLAAWYQGHPA